MLQFLKRWFRRETHVFVHFDEPMNICVSGDKFVGPHNTSILKQDTRGDKDIMEPALDAIEIPEVEFGQDIEG